MGGDTKRRIGDLEIEINELRKDNKLLVALLAERPTIRDQFAMAALAVVGANTAWQKPIDGFEAANTAYKIADAMLEARTHG